MANGNGPLAGPEKPSSSFFGNLLRSLYPAGQYEGVIPPEQLDLERRMALRRTGAALLASGGTRLQGTDPGFMANLGAAFAQDDWGQRLAGVAQSAQQLQVMQQKAARQEQIDALIRQHSVAPGQPETDRQRDDRMLALSNALQGAGFMDEAKSVADLRSSLRSPNVATHGNLIYDPRDGTVIGEFPKELATVGGAALHSDAMKRLGPYEDIARDVEIVNRIRGVKGALSAPESAQLVSTAERLLNTRKAMDQARGGMGALENLAVVGPLAKLVGSLVKTEPLSPAQRNQLMTLVDQMISQLAREREGVIADVQRIYRENFKDDASYNRMWNSLPVSPSFGVNSRAGIPAGEASPDDMDANRIRRQ